MDYLFNFWSNLFAIISIVVSVIIAIWVYKLSKRLSSKDRYQHEIKITEEINKLGIYRSVILADVKKYNPLRTDYTNKTYYKQEAELYTIVPEFGVQFILRPSNNDEGVPVGLIPFEWIEYIRDYDSEDNKPIIVCKFKGVKWYKKFKAPFVEINYFYEKPHYKEGSDPKFMKFTTIKPTEYSKK